MRMGFVVLALIGLVADGDAKRRQRSIGQHILGEFSRTGPAGGGVGSLMGECDKNERGRAQDAQCPLLDLSRPFDQLSLSDRPLINAAGFIFNASN